jgi:octaprenyl-diphosphate synthase
MNNIDKIKRPILAEMQEFEKVYSQVLHNDNTLLVNVHNYIMTAGGKKLRPILTLLATKICGEVNTAALYGALSLELLHTASLVHDDVIDDTPERRGRAAVNARWTNKIAVLTGDYILSKSLYCANKTKNLDIMEAISIVGMVLPDGELLQLAQTKQTSITEQDYFQIIKKKTALLFATCMHVGGLSAGADEVTLEKLKKAGEYIGICFQIKDDIFDYFEDAEIGKPTGNDVRDGKLTLPLIYALKSQSGPERDEIIKLIDNQEFSLENIDKTMQFAHAAGGVEYAQQVMDEYKQKALSELSFLPENDAKQALMEYVEFVAAREF